MKDYYKTLGVRATASPENIHARWIELMRKFHPDRRKKGGAQDERIKEINEAYEVLKHSSARGHYDLQRTYYQKKRTLHLQRFILPPIILLVLLFLGLIYFQRSNVTPSPESTLASVRRLISIKASAPNEINQIDEINESNQTNPTSVPKDRKASPLFAKAKDPLKVQKPAPSPNQPSIPNAMGKTKQAKNEGNPTDSRNPTNQINEINQTNQIDQISDPNVLTDPNHPNDLNDPNELNHVSQLTPPPLLATEEEVKHFFAQYRERYNRKDIEGFLSLFSPRAVQNGMHGFDEIKEIYSGFFDQSQQLRYDIEDTQIQIYQNAVEAWGRYRIDQTPRKGRKQKVWTGDARWILLRENGDLKIRFLDFRPQESR